MGLVEVMVFVVESINNNLNILLDIIFGYDIFDINFENCWVMKFILDFVNVYKFVFVNFEFNEICMILFRGKFFLVVVVVGIGILCFLILVLNLLEVEDILFISYVVISDEFSSSVYLLFFCIVFLDCF